MRQPALNADFGRAQLPRPRPLSRHVFERVKVGVFFARPAAEGAELASHKTNVREIDVAVHDVGHDIAGEFGAQEVRRGQQAEQIVALGMGESVRLIQRQVRAVLCFENALDGERTDGVTAARCQTIREMESFEFRVVSSRGTCNLRATV